MSRVEPYCPTCDRPLSKPIMPLEYLLCKSCNMSVHERDAVSKKSTSILVGDWTRSELPTGPITYTTKTESYHNPSRISVPINVTSVPTRQYGCLALGVVYFGSTNQPSSATFNGNPMTLLHAEHDASSMSVAMFYLPTTENGSSGTVEVFWATGLKPYTVVLFPITMVNTNDSPADKHKASHGASSEDPVAYDSGETGVITLTDDIAFGVVGVFGDDGQSYTSANPPLNSLVSTESPIGSDVTAMLFVNHPISGQKESASGSFSNPNGAVTLWSALAATFKHL